MKFIRIPIRVAKAEEVDMEESLGIPAESKEGTAIVNIDCIEYIIGDERTATIYLRDSEDVLDTNLSIGDLVILLED